MPKAKDKKKKVVKKEKKVKAKRTGEKYLVSFSFTNPVTKEVEDYENEVTARRMLSAVAMTLRESKGKELKSRKIKDLTLSVKLANVAEEGEEIEDISDEGVEV